MTMTTTEQTILNIIETDVLTIGGAPLMTLLQNLAAHKGNGPLQAADLLQFTATAPGAGMSIGVELEGQLLQLAIAKLQAAMASKGATGTGTTPMPAAAS